MPIEDLKEVSEGQPISARVFNTLIRAIQSLSNLSVQSPLEMHQGPTGATLSLSVDVNPFIVRIDSNYDGQGVYKGYIVPPPIDTTISGSLSSTNSVKLGNSDMGQKDGEQVIVWNAAELTPAGTTGTSRTHLLPANTFIPNGVWIGNATLQSSTNKARIIIVDHSIGGSIDLLQAGTNVVTASPFLNIPTNRGTASILEFVTATISGRGGSNLQFAAPASNRVVITALGSNWVQGYVRFHS